MLFRLTRAELFGLHRDIAAALAAMPDSAETGHRSGNDHTTASLGAEALVECCPLPVHACFSGGPDLIGSCLQRNALEDSPDWLKTSASASGRRRGLRGLSRPDRSDRLVPPEELMGEIYEFYARVGGGYRMSLLYPPDERAFRGRTVSVRSLAAHSHLLREGDELV
jgi:hypothetical protein